MLSHVCILPNRRTDERSRAKPKICIARATERERSDIKHSFESFYKKKVKSRYAKRKRPIHQYFERGKKKEQILKNNYGGGTFQH